MCRATSVELQRKLDRIAAELDSAQQLYGTWLSQQQGDLVARGVRIDGLGRELDVHFVTGVIGHEVVRVAREGHFDLLILPLPETQPVLSNGGNWTEYVLSSASVWTRCRRWGRS